MFSVSSWAGEDASRFDARAEVNWRYGQDRGILMSEFWVPIMQDDGSVFYGDLRMMGDNQDNREGNLGFGYRNITNVPVLGDGVAGVHGWFDRRITARGSYFNQITLGGEWLGERFDVLANGYIPLSDERTITIPNANPQGAALVGTGIVVDTDGTVIEEPQHGFDIELGLELGSQSDFIKAHTDSVRLYGGGYYFDGDKTDKVAGWRARVAADVSSDMQVGMRFQRDAVRGSQGFLEATIRFPFGQKKSYRKEGLRARLDESPERDIDIVTNEVVTDTGERVAVLNAETGMAQEVLHVDNTAAGGGDGSAEAPFNTLAAAEAAASAQGIIYVSRGDGTSTNQNAGITLNKTGQQLIGSGANFIYDSGRFTTANGKTPTGTIIASAGAAPVITNAAANSDGITVAADDVMVAGVTVDGATRDGVVVTNVQDVEIKDVVVSGNDGRGVFVNATGAANVGVKIQDSVISGNLSNGIELADVSTGTIEADFGGGELGSTGNNNIFGNIDTEIEVDLDGGNLSALNNFWGGGALVDTNGVDAGNINAGSFSGGAVCSSCVLGLSGTFTAQSNVQESQVITANTLTASGFVGSRYITITGGGTPELVINGVPQGTATAKINNGDTVAVRTTSSTTGLATQSVALQTGVSASSFGATTRFLPNALSGLSVWLDAADLNGDFDYTNNPGAGGLPLWDDKSGNNNDAAQGSVGAQPITGTRTINGLNVLDFDGGADFLSGNNLALSNYTKLVVFARDANVQNNTISHVTGDQDALYGQTSNRLVGYHSTNLITSGATLTLGQAYVAGATGTAAGGMEIFLDGNSEGTGSNPHGGPAGLNYLVGRHGSGNYMNGTIGEIVVFDRVLNTTEYNQVGSYLKTKWNTP